MWFENPFKKKEARSKKEIVDEAIVQLNAPSPEKKPNTAKIVAESQMADIESGELDPATLPEKEIPTYYDAMKAKLGFWEKQAELLDIRLPELSSDLLTEEPEEGAPKPDLRYHRDKVIDAGLSQMGDAPSVVERKRIDKAFAGIVGDMMEGVEKGQIDLMAVPQKDIPAYAQAVQAKIDTWKAALKKLENRVMKGGTEENDESEQQFRKAA